MAGRKMAVLHYFTSLRKILLCLKANLPWQVSLVFIRWLPANQAFAV
jgi:hypothetical protein